jgi:hypothetical protein
MRLVPVLLASALLLTGCGAGASGAPDSSEELARAYVGAINARDGERVCGLMTRAVAAELSVTDSNIPCDRTVAGLIGYVEDAGMPEFLRYRLGGVRSGATRGEYSSIRLSLEARRRSTSGEQGFETCSFEDTVWLTREAGELRIAKPSAALYIAAGATNVPGGVSAPPGLKAAGEDEGPQLIDCEPESGKQPDPEAAPHSAAGFAARTAQELSVSDVRCFEAEGSDGWDVVCTYFDPRMGERMKLAYRVDPLGAISSSGAVPGSMPLPPAP